MANDISSLASANSSSDLRDTSGRETALHRSRMPLAGNDKPVGEQDQLDANKAALVDAKTVREQAKAEREAQKAELEKQVQELRDTASFVDSKRAELGAVQNRMESTIRNQSNISENLNAARSRIRDADFATETANMTKQNILQQAASSILSQANQRPQSALSLLQG